MSTLAGFIIGFAGGVIATLIVQRILKKKAVSSPGGTISHEDEGKDEDINEHLG